MEAHRHPNNILYNKPADPVRKLTLFSNLPGVDIFALEARWQNRNAARGMLQFFIFLNLSSNLLVLLCGGAGDHLQFLQRTLSIVENRYPLGSAMIRDMYGIWLKRDI